MQIESGWPTWRWESVRARQGRARSKTSRVNSRIRTEYRGKWFWSWNGILGETELKRQIQVLKEIGIGGFSMYSHGGRRTEYLGGQRFHVINSSADEAERLGVEAQLYDEDRRSSATSRATWSPWDGTALHNQSCDVCPDRIKQYDGCVREILIDLNADAGETTNLVAMSRSRRERLEEGRRLLKQWYAENDFNLRPGHIV